MGRQGASGGERGSASLELVGILPFLILAVLVAAQLGLAGASLWSAAVAARAGARASLVGRSARSAALRTLPLPLRDGAAVREKDGVAVDVPVPRLLPLIPSFAVSAEMSLDGGG